MPSPKLLLLLASLLFSSSILPVTAQLRKRLMDPTRTALETTGGVHADKDKVTLVAGPDGWTIKLQGPYTHSTLRHEGSAVPTSTTNATQDLNSTGSTYSKSAVMEARPPPLALSLNELLGGNKKQADTRTPRIRAPWLRTHEHADPHTSSGHAHLLWPLDEQADIRAQTARTQALWPHRRVSVTGGGREGESVRDERVRVQAAATHTSAKAIGPRTTRMDVHLSRKRVADARSGAAYETHADTQNGVREARSSRLAGVGRVSLRGNSGSRGGGGRVLPLQLAGVAGDSGGGGGGEEEREERMGVPWSVVDRSGADGEGHKEKWFGTNKHGHHLYYQRDGYYVV